MPPFDVCNLSSCSALGPSGDSAGMNVLFADALYHNTDQLASCCKEQTYETVSSFSLGIRGHTGNRAEQDSFIGTVFPGPSQGAELASLRIDHSQSVHVYQF